MHANEEFMELIIKKIKNKFTDKKIIQLGITFKPNSDDLRDSQSLKLNRKLINEGFKVEIVEPNIQGYKNYTDLKDFSNNILISTFHDEFKDIDFENKKVIIIGNK